MRVLVLAPQPFYQERGTPIAVRLALEALSRKLDLSATCEPTIDLLVYREGEDITIPGVRFIRVCTPRCLYGLRPGISLKKLACDAFFFVHAIALLWRARSNQYQVVHAVEESVFIAWFAKKIFGTPYIYDMDSSLALQLTEKWRWCRPLLPLLQWLEGIAVRGSIAVAPVCDALQAIAHQHGSPQTIMLRDVSLLPNDADSRGDRSQFFGHHIGPQHTVVLYVGNLESYQGIDLLVESFSLVRSHHRNPHLVIVGGTPDSIAYYQNKARTLGCDQHISFLGPRPLSSLRDLLSAADIVVSPRVKGNNTPMKIYSYLHSGTALLATDLPTHRQVLDEEVAALAPLDTQGFASKLEALLENRQLRETLGTNARARAQKLYTIEAFERQLSTLYDTVARDLGEAGQQHEKSPEERQAC